MLQRTIKKRITIEGIGLHSGRKAVVTIAPALPNQGICFVRTDLAEKTEIPALYQNVIDTRMATVIGMGNVTVSTVEHLMAALYGMAIDNAIIEVNGPEVPILDGSSAEFVKQILVVGTQSQLVPKTFIALRKKVEVKMGEKWAYAAPFEGLKVVSTVEWDHPAIGYQEFTYVEGKTDFSEIAPARTFGFLKDVEALRKAGLAKGGSLENAIVLDQAKVLNPGGLRFNDEFVRHKVLDALGDFKLSGHDLMGEVRLHRSGHDLHRLLVAEILKSSENYVLLSAPAHQVGDAFIKKAGRLRSALVRASRVAASF